MDTNRFKMHTDARTFEAAAALQNWGANTSRAEKALCEDYLYFSMKNALIQQAKPYYNHFMIAAIDDETLDKTHHYEHLPQRHSDLSLPLRW